ncbi:hypothetical protein, partial [Vibrio sp. CAU 1672]|uniref:hypothetical protein n=1 Tax=Vibrio sp. CAU 1672 TaxID=3032594 RepID=UPI0023DB3BF1
DSDSGVSGKMDWFIPEMVSGLKRNGCPDNPGIGGWIAPEYAFMAFQGFNLWYWKIQVHQDRLTELKVDELEKSL